MINEPSDGIAEELERQLQLALATAAIAARQAIATHEHTIQQAQRDSEHNAQAAQTRIKAERLLAAERLRPVFDPAWWETAGPQDIADAWQEANTWRDPDHDVATPTIFNHAADRIREQVRDRTGLDVTQVLALAAVQEHEHQHQTTTTERDAPGQPADLATGKRDSPTPRAFDDPRRREQLRERLAAANVPEAAIDARTLADVGQAREPAEAAHTPAATEPRPRPAARHTPDREPQRRR